MPQLFGGVEVLDEVEVLTGNVRVLGAISYLRRLYKALDEAGFGGMVMIDLGLVHEMDYYTGIMFRGYCGGAGAAILSGGRYNALCAKFGKDMPAGGFGIDVESVAESLTGKGAYSAVPRFGTHRADQGTSGKKDACAAESVRLRYFRTGSRLAQADLHPAGYQY